MSDVMEHIFRGTMTIEKGDTFVESLSKIDSPLFRSKSQKYKGKLKKSGLVNTNLIKNNNSGMKIESATEDLIFFI